MELLKESCTYLFKTYATIILNLMLATVILYPTRNSYDRGLTKLEYLVC